MFYCCVLFVFWQTTTRSRLLPFWRSVAWRSIGGVVSIWQPQSMAGTQAAVNFDLSKARVGWAACKSETSPVKSHFPAVKYSF
jgi:hypothetical protein